MDKKDLISTRAPKVEDYNFILATWLRGLYYGNSWFNRIQKETFMRAYHLVIDRILAKPGVSVVVACLKDEPSVVLGYAVFERDVIHWVFVKKAWRNIGLAKDMIPQEINQCSHMTQTASDIKRDIIFNPFLV